MQTLIETTSKTTSEVNTSFIPSPITSVKIMAGVLPVIVNEKTANRKIGDTSVTHVSQHSCPTSCPWFNAGCYAELGPEGLIARRLNRNAVTNPVEIARVEAQGILLLTGKKNLRLHVVGDSVTEEGTKLLSAAAASYISKHGKKVWTYTHGYETTRAAWGKISVLRSVETMEQVKEANQAGFAAAMVMELPRDEQGKVIGKSIPLGEGYLGIPCPHQTGKTPSCNDCGICMNDKHLHANKKVVLFDPHGNGTKKMRKTLSVLNS